MKNNRDRQNNEIDKKNKDKDSHSIQPKLKNNQESSLSPSIKITPPLEDQNSDTQKFKDQMNSGKASILVCIRCRSLNTKEIQVSNIETIKILNKKIVIVLDPIEYNGHEEIFKNRSREQQYAFDYVFEQKASQQEVYDNSTKFLIPGITQGYNATVFAYGATGAGKTHTMLGTGKEPGIMVRSLTDLFSSIESSSTHKFRVKISYIEVYNETLRDLLGTGSENLDLREDPSKGSVLIGVKELEVNTSTQVFELLLKGNKNRTTESTNMNETSSRSHAILQIFVENKLKDKESEVIVGKFILVDLAGSERAANTQNSGIRLIEGASINKSLLSLGNCINALVDISNGSSKTFIPWRDSKLTRILKDSLGGNSRIVMIANISPSIYTLEDTLNTLKYANRAKNIKTNIKRNVLDVDFHINKYDEVISNLKNELESLRHSLAVKTHNSHLTSKSSSDIDHKNPLFKIDKFSKEIANHFQEEIRVRKDILETEKKIDNLTLDLKEREFELYKQINLNANSKERASNLKQKELKSSINKINDQIEICKQNLNQKNVQWSELQSKREEIQSSINKFSKEPLGASLNLTYQYYIVLLDNMALDHKKNLNLLNLKQKEVKLNKLIDQIKLRDVFIDNAKTELSKKGVKLNNKEEIKSIENLNIDHSYVLPVVIHQPQENINKYSYSQGNKNNSSNSLKQVNFTSRSKSPYEGYSNPNIVKEKKKFKSKTTEIIDKVKKNQLTDTRLNMINELYPSSKVFYLNSNNPNKKISSNRMHTNNIIAFDTRNLNQSFDRNKNDTSMHSDNSRRSASKLREREVDKKVKSILIKKSIVARHKNSPYINNKNSSKL